MSNDGKLFEEVVYNMYKSKSTAIKIIDEGYETIRHYKVKKNYMVEDYKTNEKRQVDIAIFIDSYEGEKFIAVECKNHKAPIDVQDVESFISKLNSICASKGIMISTSGFTKGARKLVCSSLGIDLKLMTIEQLFEYLYHDYNYYNGECCICKKIKSGKNMFNKEKIHSVVLYQNFDNVITKKGKYLKIYNGRCNECHTINYLNGKCGEITPLFYLDDDFNYTWKESIIPCSDNCGLVYLIDEEGNVSYKYKDNKCRIINSGYVEF